MIFLTTNIYVPFILYVFWICVKKGENSCLFISEVIFDTYINITYVTFESIGAFVELIFRWSGKRGLLWVCLRFVLFCHKFLECVYSL